MDIYFVKTMQDILLNMLIENRCSQRPLYNYNALPRALSENTEICGISRNAVPMTSLVIVSLQNHGKGGYMTTIYS